MSVIRIASWSLVAAAEILSSATSFAQVDWAFSATRQPPPGIAPVSAYDSERGCTVLWPGPRDITAPPRDETWEWDGRIWTQRFPSIHPTPRMFTALAFDAARHRTVLFGGHDASGIRNDTWEWDGTNWTLRHPATAPPARNGHAMTFDSARGRVVLFGGFGGSTGNFYLSDMWEWDGDDWTQRTSSTSQPVRWLHQMAFDSARSRIVLYGGSGRHEEFYDTWEFDGNDWSEVQPQLFAYSEFSLVFDTNLQRVVMFEPHDLDSLLEWDGSVWSPIANTGISPVDGPAAYDTVRHRLIVGGGVDGLGVPQTWEWDESRWILRQSGAPPRSSFGLTCDTTRRRITLFGGRDFFSASDDTWEWDGIHWNPLSPPNRPPARSRHAMAYDPVRRRTVLFGGSDGLKFHADTWQWDGTNWTNVSVSPAPRARVGHSMTHDPASQRVLLFGGSDNAGSIFGDTWQWDGAAWIPLAPARSPSSRTDAAMTADPARGVIVLVGGRGAGGAFSDTWEWDGASWNLRTPSTIPPARYGQGMAYDPGRRSCVMFGGIGAGGERLADGWEWDGMDWRPLPTPTHPSARAFHAMAFDTECGEVMLVGGNYEPTSLGQSDQWKLVTTSVAVFAVAPGIGAESGGDPVQIFGSGFTDAEHTTVSFGDSLAPIIEISCGRSMIVETPPGSGSVTVTVTNTLGTAVLTNAFTYAPTEITTRFGNVNAGAGSTENVLLVNGNVGDVRREITLTALQEFVAYMSAPSSRSEARFVLYAWVGSGNSATVRALPHHLGSLVFPLPVAGASPQPSAILNNIGSGRALGTPTLPSRPAPSELIRLRHGLRRAGNFTLQGIIQDDGSRTPFGYSVTNAIVLHVR
ncbi:MAG: IPT/TIG domain-containing protein [Planctomycetes bacterium]|nr:IPT/TIG domain-containing protein [Planctomycetota bacterium]